MLGEKWLGQVLAKMQLTYPGRFPPRLMPASAIRAEWARELDGLTPLQLRQGIATLPKDFPPTAPDFAILCRAAPTPTGPPPPPEPYEPASPEKVSIAKEIMERTRGPGDPLKWARTLRAREARGEKLSRVQMAAWRDALRVEMMIAAREAAERGDE